MLLNYTSFTSRFYKIRLITCLIDRAYKINNTWPGFHDDVSKIKDVLKRNFIFLLPILDKIITKLCKQYCKENNVKILFTSFKISNYFSAKNATPYFLKSFLVYKFVCAKCKSCYIGETCRHFITRIDEHIKKDKKSHVFQDLHSKEECISSFDLNCVSILDSATTKYQTKLKEGMYIDWEKPNLNKQKSHLSTTLSI